MGIGGQNDAPSPFRPRRCPARVSRHRVLCIPPSSSLTPAPIPAALPEAESAGPSPESVETDRPEETWALQAEVARLRQELAERDWRNWTKTVNQFVETLWPEGSPETELDRFLEELRSRSLEDLWTAMLDLEQSQGENFMVGTVLLFSNIRGKGSEGVRFLAEKAAILAFRYNHQGAYGLLTDPRILTGEGWSRTLELVADFHTPRSYDFLSWVAENHRNEGTQNVARDFLEAW